MVQAVPRPLPQPNSRSTGMMISKVSNTPGQPAAIVCTKKVTRPPIAVPKTRAPAAFQV